MDLQTSKDLGLEREYVLDCEIVKVATPLAQNLAEGQTCAVEENSEKSEDSNRRIKDGQATRQFSPFHLLLVPKEGTQRDLFLSAWLPPDDVDPDSIEQEVLIDVGYPIRLQKRRAALNYPNSLFSKNFYLRIMDEDLSEKLLKRKEEVSVCVLTQSAQLEAAQVEMD